MLPDAKASWPWPGPYDFLETTRLLRTGGSDPTFIREAHGFRRAAWTGEGAAAVRVTVIPGESVHAAAWGPGAKLALRAVPGLLGLDEAPWRLPAHPVTDRLLHQYPGVRLTNTGAVFEALVNTVLHQQVTWIEAARCWRRLVEACGEPAPGPAGLSLPPAAAALRRAGVDRMVALGIGYLRAKTLYEAAFSASRLERAAGLPTPDALRLLMRIRGVGPWTAANVLGLRLARPEPLVLGDIHLPHTVSWALAGEARGSDARMQELLVPFEGQAFRVVRLLHAAGMQYPRRAPKRAVRSGR